MAASSNSDATSKRKRESSSSESSPGKRIIVSSPLTDPSLSSPTMAGSQDVSRASDTVPETAQLQQQDSEPVHEAEPENDQKQDIGYNADESDNEDKDMDADEDEDAEEEEEELAPIVPEHRPLIRVVSRILYQEHNQEVVARSFVGAIFADECSTWLELSESIRLIYYIIADQEAVGHEVVHDGNIAPLQSWPGRIVRFYSSVDGQLIERFWPQDNWVSLDLANYLDVVALHIPVGRVCRIVVEIADGTKSERDQIVIQNMESWEEFAARIRVVFYREIFDQVAPDLEEVSPLNCCPGAHVTFWGDLKEEWFFGDSKRDGHEQDNWPAARLGICKVVISH